jgi:hypothetical protein
MAIDTPNGQFRAAPRVIDIKDTRAGCPGVAANGTTLASASVSVASSAIWWAHARVIMRPASAGKIRCDMLLRLNGNGVKTTLETATDVNGTAVANWEELNASAMGTLAAGTHNFSMTGENGPSCWGCGTTWGEVSLMIWEAT